MPIGTAAEKFLKITIIFCEFSMKFYLFFHTMGISQ